MPQPKLDLPESEILGTKVTRASGLREKFSPLESSSTEQETDLPALSPSAPETIESTVALESPAKPKKPWLFLVGAIALGALAIGGWRYWEFWSSHVSTENAQLRGHLSPIAAKISANVEQILVKEGDYVTAGQTLVIMTDQDLPWKLQQAEAGVAIAKARFQAAQATVQLTSQTHEAQLQQSGSRVTANQATILAAQAKIAQNQAAVNTSQARVAQVETEVGKTAADWQRYSLLFSQGAVSAQQADSARAAYDNAQANLAATQQTVRQAEADVANAQAQLAQALANTDVTQGQLVETQVGQQNITVQKSQQQLAQAQVQQAQADLALVKQQQEYTVIRAPISGYIGELTAQVGQKTQVGQPLLSLVPLDGDRVYVQANFKETEIHKLEIGKAAMVAIDAYPNEKFAATIAGISPATGASFALIPPDNATGNFNKVTQWVPVRLTFAPNADPAHHLRPGLSVTVTVNTR